VRGVPSNRHPYRDNKELDAYNERNRTHNLLTETNLDVDRFLATYRNAGKEAFAA
jgi:hypothetical protein